MNNLRDRLTICQYQLILQQIRDHSIKSIVLDKSKTHQKKLFNLWNKQRKSKTPDCVINLSSYKLSLSEKSALMFGFKRSIMPKHIDEIKTKASIESQTKKVCLNENKTLNYDMLESLRNSTTKFISESNKACATNKNKAIHRTLINLARNKNIRCLNMDKGNGVVIMNTKDYNDKMNKILEDGSRFKKLNFDPNSNNYSRAPWYLKEKTIYRLVYKYIKPLVTDKVYYKLIPKGTQPGKMYGFAKNHKTNCPLRPVLSATKTPEYALCKWLETELKPYLKSDWIINSSFEFVEKLKDFRPLNTDICVTFDIKSLYTNVPLEETINNVTKVVYIDNPSSIFARSKMTQTVFKNLLRVCSQSMFLLNGAVYQQTNVLSTGSLFAPLLTNWFK